MKNNLKKSARFTLLAGSALVLVACSGRGISYDHTSGIDVSGPARHGQGYTLVDNTNPADAFVQIPDRIMRGISMDERVYANGISQTLTLAADAAVRGSNHIKINLVSRGTFTDMTERLEIHGAEAHQIRSQFKATFPGKPFAMDQSLHSNEYGNFGFVFFNEGRGVGCMYGWQSMEAASTKANTRLVKNWLRDRTASANNAKLSYRLRFCGKGLQYSDAIHLMRSVRLNVPADVFVRDRNLRWSSGGNYTGVGYRGANAQDLEYTTGEPYSERRSSLCEPGSTLGDYNAYGSTCAEKPKPVAKPVVRRRTTRTVTKPVVAPQPEKPETQVTTVVPLPVPGATVAPQVQPNVQPQNPSILEVPTIQAVPGSEDLISQGGSVPLPPQSVQQPQIAPVQPAQTPRIIPIVPNQQQTAPQAVPQIQAVGQQVQAQVEPVRIQAGQAPQTLGANGETLIPLPR